MSRPKPKVFFFHYNKPASATAGKPKLSVHFQKKCHIVDHIECDVPCSTKHQKRQPRCVMKGAADFICITKKIDGTLIAKLDMYDMYLKV